MHRFKKKLAICLNVEFVTTGTFLEQYLHYLLQKSIKLGGVPVFLLENMIKELFFEGYDQGQSHNYNEIIWDKAKSGQL